MLNNGETYSSKDTPNSIEYRDSPSSTPGGSFENLAGAQQRIASQGPSNIAESRISDAKWAELGGRPRNPPTEFETPIPTSNTQPLEVGNTTDMTPQNTTEQTINTPPKKEEIEAGNGNLVSIGHEEVAIPESIDGDIVVNVGNGAPDDESSASNTEKYRTIEEFIQSGDFPRDGKSVDPADYGIESDSIFASMDGYTMKIPKEGATLENTQLQEDASGTGFTSMRDWYENNPSSWQPSQIGKVFSVPGLPEYRQEIDANGTVSIYKPGEDNPKITFEKGFKSEGNEGASLNQTQTKTPTAPESREYSASKKEPSATSEEVDTSDIPDGFEKTINDPMMDSKFTWEKGRWVAPAGVEAFEKVKSQKGAGESLAFLINQSAGNSIPDGFAYQFEDGKIVIAPKKN